MTRLTAVRQSALILSLALTVGLDWQVSCAVGQRGAVCNQPSAPLWCPPAAPHFSSASACCPRHPPSAQGSANDFGGLTGARTVAVVDDSGCETTGRLVRVTPESLTMKFDGHERAFELTHVTTVHEVGDPLTNGLAIGFLVGGALGVVGGALVSDCGGWFEGFRTCTSVAAR